jgi:protein TonB
MRTHSEIMRNLFYLCFAPFLLAACVTPSGLPGVADPRDRPFMPTSDMPVPPNVERAADSGGCSGEAVAAVSAELPDYPARGWDRGLQGWSIVQFDVAPSGETANVEVARGVPGGSFDREARRAVRDWRFQTSERGLTGCVVLFEFTQGLVRIR